ncbi:TonB-dependent receptor [Fusobacterium sp.]|uniref:TonB-dependent receptor n=1 Tax=Fusobacterium sp. TaxID=68766 RepID=UPI0028FF8E8B|nr:TonB-dependent receptor [Fusobacterium sp.]MDU1911451.1 TonB-dependent receptor [Fusobacterium sp.]
MKKTVVLFFVLSAMNFASSEDLSVKLEDSVISGEGFYNTVRNTSKTIYTVTSDDIQESGAQSIPEALKMVPGIKIAEGYDGNGVVDIRGQGKQYNRNTAVIVDGIRINPFDWGAPDLYSIPIESIEKIEVIPANTSVVYGDNTVGGVINIITKNGIGKDRLVLGTQIESHKGAKGTVDFNTVVGNTAIFGNYLNKKSDGYRENSRSKYENVELGINSQLDEKNSILFKYSYNNSYKRLPGKLTQEKLDENREQAENLNDWMFSETNRFLGAYTYKNENLEISEQLSYQEKHIDGKSDTLQKDLSDLNNILKFKYTQGKNKVISGIDYTYGKVDIPKYLNKKLIGKAEKEGIGIFISNTYSITDKLDLQGGIRYQKTEFKYTKNSEYTGNKKVLKDKNDYSITVFNVGANYKYSDIGSAYLTFGKDFRTPLANEMLSGNGWFEDIKPQESYTAELGIRDFYKDIYINSSVFYTLIEDEIYFKTGGYNTVGDSGINTNYDGKSEKIGYELFLEKIMTEKLRLNGSYSFIYSKFKTGEYKNNYIPGVSKNKAAIGVNYKVTDDLGINLTGNYYGKSYALSDEKNKQKKVDSYINIDLSMSYEVNESFRIYGGIKNLTNEHYNESVEETIPWGKTEPVRYYYPAMERRYFLGFEYRAI